MALLRIITFLIHAIAAAFATMMTAVIAHVAPVLLAAAAVVACVVMFCTTCGIGGLALGRRRKSR